MTRVTERILDLLLDLLRLMHAGVPLKVLPKGTAMLDMSRVATGVRRATVEQMAMDGLIEHDVDHHLFPSSDFDTLPTLIPHGDPP